MGPKDPSNRKKEKKRKFRFSQTFPKLMGNMASEATFDPWKVVFS